MTMMTSFAPLKGAIDYVGSLKPDLDACQTELRSTRSEFAIARAAQRVSVGVMLGEWLPILWRAAFNIMLRSGSGPWQSVKEFEAQRQVILGLFHTVQEAMATVRKIAQTAEDLTGKAPPGVNRLDELINDARRLEEHVFRDWPSFDEPMVLTDSKDSMSPEESLAEALSITVEEARLKMDARRLVEA